ncbi:MAG: carbohydrate ABC transporter permease [Clostridia bacterium]|nr:carbohydrate ABC transporter permease [Clostridia bacterium]
MKAFSLNPFARSGANKTADYKKIAMETAVTVFRYAMIIAVGYTVLSPLLQIISNSLKSDADFMNTSVTWIPTKVFWQNYKDALFVMDYWRALLHTLLVPVLSGLMEVASCGIAAYGFARFQFPEKKILFPLLLLTILVPVRMTFLSSFVNYRNFNFFGLTALIGKWIGKDLTINLINTPFTFYLPSIFGIGFQSGLFVMIYIQFLKGIPKELEEAAWIDGAGPVKTLNRIIVPSSGVAILTVSILSVIWHWNEYYLMGLYFNENRPLAVVLSDIMNLIQLKGGSAINSHTGVAMASCMLFILPVLIFYLILQKKFIKSIDRVGIVG